MTTFMLNLFGKNQTKFQNIILPSFTPPAVFFNRQPNRNKEKEVSLASKNKTETFNEKWYTTNNILPVTY